MQLAEKGKARGTGGRGVNDENVEGIKSRVDMRNGNP